MQEGDGDCHVVLPGEGILAMTGEKELKIPLNLPFSKGET
jgi:hypothetical protein